MYPRQIRWEKTEQLPPQYKSHIARGWKETACEPEFDSAICPQYIFFPGELVLFNREEYPEECRGGVASLTNAFLYSDYVPEKAATITCGESTTVPK